MTQYQRRMKQFIWTYTIYGVVCPITLIWIGASAASWVVFASTLTLLHGIAIGCDAVYDSLSERLPRLPIDND